MKHIPKISPELRRLLLDCETECVVECCLEKAFDISTHRIEQWFRDQRIYRRDDIKNELENIISNCKESEYSEVLIETRSLYSRWYKEDFLEFVTELLENLNKEDGA